MLPDTPAARATARLRLALLGYLLGIIAAVTLAPFRFHWPARPRLLWHGNPFDLATNLVFFLPLGFFYAWRHQDLPRRPSAAAFGLAVSTCAELAQLLLPGRYSSLLDVLANSLGCWLGAGLYERLRRHLHARLVGQLALELPLMQVFYLLLPLLWLHSLAAGKEGTRLGLAPLLGLCGSVILAAVWRHRLQPARVLSPILLSLAVALWFLVGVMPRLPQQPRFLLASALGLALATAVQTRGLSLAPGAERRFEGLVLRRLWPLYGAYLGLMALWPWPWTPQPWRGSLGLADLADIPAVVPLLRLLESLAAFTLFGYLVAESRGRRRGRLWSSLGRALLASAVTGAVLEAARGFHPQHGASLAALLLATAAGGIRRPSLPSAAGRGARFSPGFRGQSARQGLATGVTIALRSGLLSLGGKPEAKQAAQDSPLSGTPGQTRRRSCRSGRRSPQPGATTGSAWR
ncbi:MAG: hypothetical protein KatS3mg131_0943 [Candidatus Tectimicrobiota bacterium]|nr:MAG: hypothetical protein KatS3mg131_0943 [Candidatus Tectomicrobia bacterium]